MWPLQAQQALFPTLFALALLHAFPNSLLAQDTGSSYFGVSGGAVLFNPNEIRDHDLDFDVGFIAAGTVGYIFGSVRTEGEVSYSKSNLQFGVEEEELTVLRGTAGLYFDFLGFGTSSILPYAGAGFGIAALEFGDRSDDSDVALTAHGEIGVSFAASSSLDVVFCYRFQHFETNIEDADDQFQSHQIRAGLRFF